MAGHMVRLLLIERGHDVYSIGRSVSPDWDAVDVEDDRRLKDYIAQKRPEVVVNCIGILINESKINPERSIRINSLLPWILSRLGSEFSYRLIHLSSDCVFSGKSGPYREDDFRDADDTYGRAKAMGELMNERDLVIRTSIVGPELKTNGTGLFGWFMRQSGKINGYACAQWSGVTTLEMAKAVNSAIGKGTTGLIHLTNGNPISKYDLLLLFKEIWKRFDIEIERDVSRVSDRSLISTRADYLYPVPSYREMLVAMKAFMDKHQELYNIYEKSAVRY